MWRPIYGRVCSPCFNPWFIGRVGINAYYKAKYQEMMKFQSLVYWKGGDKYCRSHPWHDQITVSILGLLEGWG